MASWMSKVVATHEALPGIRFTGVGQDMKAAEHKLRMELLGFVSVHGDKEDLRHMIKVFNRDKQTLEKLERAGFKVEIINKTGKARKCYG